MDYRFGCPETFARAFKRMFGIQPSQLREHGVLSCQMLPPLLPEYLEHINGPNFQKPKLVELTGQNRTWRIVPTPNPAAGQKQFDTLLNLVPDQGTCFWLAENGNNIPFQQFLTGQASGFTDTGISMAGFSTLIASDRLLPEGKYIWIQYAGAETSLPMTLAYLFHTWLPKTGLQPVRPLQIIIQRKRLINDQPGSGYQVIIPIQSALSIEHGDSAQITTPDFDKSGACI